MLGLKADAYQINVNGEGQYEFFSDISTRTLESVRIGEGAGKISRGSGNAFVGYESGKENNLGSFGVFVGFQAGALNLNGDYNTYVGAFAGRNNTRGYRNTFVGFQAGQLNKDGSDCTAVGSYALRENTTGNKNVAVGNRAGQRILDGDNNTMIGMESGQDIRSGTNNTMAGYRSGRGSFKGNENTYFGAFSGYSNSLGDGNAFVGYKAGEFLTKGNFNVAVGAYALQKASYGDCNIAIGAFAGSVITGSGNVFVGGGAAAGNTGGDNNTNIGNNAGFEGTGSDNVYIGKNAAYSLDGNKNVVIGVNAYPKDNSTGSVVIGYGAGGQVFNTGESNIFIGIGADAFVNLTSHAIAIGSKKTYAYTHSISIGEDINNGGVNSLSLGYDILTDADQCITLGNGINISSVQVFNDPLSYLFPINNTEAYRTFYLTENYTETLYLNNVSNEVAIARINNSNIYDSGNNLLKGKTLAGDNNLRSIFNYNILYQGITFEYQTASNIIFNYDNYLFNTDKVLTTDNFLKSALTLETTGTFNLASNALESTKIINFNGLLLSYLNTSNNLISSNLIPVTIPRFNYIINIVKRNALFRVLNSNIYNASFFTPVNIPITNNLIQRPDELRFSSIIYEDSNYVLTPPNYGFVNSNIVKNRVITYQIYPEAYYSSNDSLQIATLTKFKNNASTDSNIYALVPEDYLIPTQKLIYNCNLQISMSSNIYLHPYFPSYFDRSFLNVTPYNNINTQMIFNIETNNVSLTYQNTTSNYLQIAYSNFLNNPVTLNIINKNSSVNKALSVTFLNKTYNYNLLYSSNINDLPVNSNITISILPFSLVAYKLPISIGTNVKVIDYPKFGNIGINSEITYTPAFMNNEDNFKILVNYNSTNHIYYNVNVSLSNVFHSITMNKMQQPITTSGLSNHYTQTRFEVFNNLIFNTEVNSNVILPNNPSPYGETAYTLYFTKPYLGYYDTTQGYLFRSNITTSLTYAGPLLVPLEGYPGPFDLDNGKGRDFIKYNPYLPRRIYKRYRWDSPTPYETTTVTLTANLDEFRYNNLTFNRYYTLGKEYIHEEYYKLASNLTLYSSNETIHNDYYYDKYNNYIYTSNYYLNTPTRYTSNFELITATTSNLRYTASNYNILTERFLNFSIPTVQVQKSYMFQPNTTYTINTSRTSNNLIILQKNKGRVNQFHQSNINNLEIHIWNTRDPYSVLYDTCNITFTDNKQININYFRNSTANINLVNITDNQNILFNNNIASDRFIFRYDDSGSLLLFAIQHTSNITFMNNATKRVSLNYTYSGGNSEIADVYGIPDNSYSNTGFIDYINYSITSLRKPVLKTIPIEYKRSQDINYNIGLSETPIRYLTSNDLYYANNNDSSYFKITAINNTLITKNNTRLIINDTFTQEDINKKNIIISTSNLQNGSINFDLYNNNSYATNLVLNIKPISTTSYLSSSSSNTTSNIILQLKDSYNHLLYGTIWDYLKNNNNKDVTLNILKQPTKGFLARSNLSTLTRISYNDLQRERIYYIPYTPMSLSNDSYTCFLELSNVISPVYTIPLKNYWSRWSDIVNITPTYNTISLTRSHGMIEDDIKWAPDTIYNINTKSNIELRLSYHNIPIRTDIYYAPVTQRPYFKQTINYMFVDNANYSYLNSLLNATNNPNQDTIFSIIKAPEHGVILTKLSETQFEAKPQFTANNIRNKDVFYQHYGKTQEEDSFVVKVSTTPFDISSTSLSNIITISEAPKLTVNNYDYIFYENSNDGKNNYNILNSTRLNLSKGFINIYETSNIDIYRLTSNSYTPTNIIFANELLNNTIYYRPSSNFFASDVNNNESMFFRFTVNSNDQNVEPNKLSVFSIYKELYTQEWYSKYNTYESFNTLSNSINPNQSITYTKFVNTTCNLDFHNKRCRIEYDFLPFQQSLNNPNLSTETNNKYLKLIKTFYYSFELIDTSDNNIFTATFTHSNLYIQASNLNLNIQTNITMNNILWNKFYIINFDNLNNNKLSIYLNNINYGANQNIPSLDLSNLKQIKLNVPIYDSLNYYNFSLTSNLSPGTNIYYNLINYNTQLRFRNFNILLGTYDVTTAISLGSTSTDIYNIIIGNQLDITGLNNICLGKNFKTSGKGSIILGSDIGIQYNLDGSQQLNTFNEIFNSIVISNDSFTNSKVRDVIAIGNDILNDITEDIEEFLSKKPVLVGNNINSSKIDFHVNFQNTFLKTTVGSPQIYCGLQEENVCIGYTSNIKVNNEYKLHVNGGAEFNGPIAFTNNNITNSRFIFGNIVFNSGTLQTCKITASWDNLQASDYHAFSINCKFRFIKNDGTYAFRRFEVWITPKNDIINNKPNLLSDLEVASFYTADITNFTHYVQRNEINSINLFITWTTAVALTTTDYIIATLELESSYPSALGSLKYTTPIAI